MAKKLAYLLLSTFLLTSCANDFDLNYEADPFPVVYCQVNPCDSFCYLSLSKSFNISGTLDEVLQKGMPNKVDNADIKLELWGQDYKAWESPLELVPMPNELLSQGTQRSIYKTTIPLALYDPLSAPGNNSPWVYDHFRLVINSSDFEDVIYSRIPIPTLPDLM